MSSDRDLHGLRCFADDTVICCESREQVDENLERRRYVAYRRGTKVSRTETRYQVCEREEPKWKGEATGRGEQDGGEIQALWVDGPEPRRAGSRGGEVCASRLGQMAKDFQRD